MSLPAPSPRHKAHTRTIHCDGYLRDDGLWDIEATIIDSKHYTYTEPYRGVRPPGTHVHGMQVRLTVDSDKVVRDIVVTMPDHPYPNCVDAIPNFRKLIGASVGRGWRRAVNDAVGGVNGCTHVRELLFPMATVVFQTVNGWPDDGERPLIRRESDAAFDPSGFVNGCKAWDVTGEMVRALHPHLYRPTQGRG